MARTFAGSVGSLLATAALVSSTLYSSSSLAQSDTVDENGEVTYIIKARGGVPSLGAFSTSARALNAGYVSTELLENVEGTTETKALKVTGFVLAKTVDPDAMEEALTRIYGVDSFEKSRFIYRTDAYQDPHPPNLGTDEPSNMSMAPWMKDIEGFAKEDQFRLDPTVAYAEGGTATTPSPHPSVKVAIIDTGATVGHPFLRPALAYNEREAQRGEDGIDDDGDGTTCIYKDDIWGWNTTNDSNDVTETGTDHGSHVAGIVKTVRDQAGATVDYADAARRMEILPIRFISETMVGSTAAAIKAIEYARCRKAKVINASWGAAGKDSFSQQLYDAFAEAYTKDDIFIAVAAGNAEGSLANNNDDNPYFPASYNIPSLMTVASITPEYSLVGGAATLTYKGLSDFSNYGANSVDVAAPGGYRSPNGDTSGIWSANAHSTSGSSMYIRKKGTSMATPVVAGIAGMIRSINTSLTAYETEQIIEQSVVKMDSLSTRVRTGGYVNARKAFDLALHAVSAGAKPAIPSEPYSTYAATTTQVATGKKSSSGGGGCGMIAGPASGPSGPFGGNSLGLVTVAYFLAQLSRKIKRNLKSHRV